NDTVEDSGETFEVVLSNPTPAGVRLADARATVTIRNSEADLDGLTVQGAPGAGGPYANLDIGAFAPETTDYAVTVPYGTTHALMRAMTDDRFLGLKTGAGSELTVVNRGTWGPAVALEVGDNTLVMVASARSGDQRTYRVTVTREARALSSNADLSGLSVEAGADGSFAALDIGAFAHATTSYAVSVPYGTTHARLTATAAHAKAALKAGAAGSLAAVSSGSAGAGVALSVGANALAVQVIAEDGTVKTYRVTVTRAAAQQESEPEPQEVVQQEEESAQQQQQRLDPLTATLENVPPEHDGGAAFAIDLRFSEAPGGVAPSAASFRVEAGGVAGVERVSADLWRVRVQPKNWKDVTVTLSTPVDCAEAGAVCASGSRALSNTLTATVGGPVRVRVEGARQSGEARAREGKDEALEFAVTLNRAAAREVSVDYATADDTATAGADYTAVSGTLVFAAGETAKTVSVPVLDDAVDEGKERLYLHLSNPRGAYLRSIHRRARGGGGSWRARRRRRARCGCSATRWTRARRGSISIPRARVGRICGASA
ncbi:MAG: cadherin-like beta sandwich domain-containing protein, partial [Chloroflexi bacterium]|nr:cadherin-like beta sandwich domain-containing protein [Chloroflexota bacterium]